MAIPGAGPLPQPTKKALAAQKKAAASLSINKKGQDPAATVVDVPKHKVCTDPAHFVWTR